jgi:hypothetical protein
MFRKLLALTLLLPVLTTPALGAGDLSDEDVFELVGSERTCSDGGFTDVAPREVGIPIVALDPNHLYEYCFKLPKLKKKDLGVRTSGLVQLKTANLGNTSCGTATAFLIRPDRKPLIGAKNGSPRTYASIESNQPAGVLFYTPGWWRVLIKYEDGCNKYAVKVTW